MEKERLQLTESHYFVALGRRLLLNVPTGLFYEVNNVVADLVQSASRNGTLSAAGARMLKKYRREDVDEAVAYLEEEGFFVAAPPEPPKPPLRNWPMRTLELCITHACNLACRYCYGGKPGDVDCALRYGAERAHMDQETALRGVDFLFKASGRLKRINVVFFGGEPFLNFELMRRVTGYCRAKEKQTGKRVNLSVVTNGTRLNEETARFVKANRIGVQISIDGPARIQDSNRPFPGGASSYETVIEGMQALRKAGVGHLPARATAAHNGLDNLGVLKHLVDLGFSSVHIEPALGDSAYGALTRRDVAKLIRQEEEVAAFFVDQIKAGHYFNYHSLVRHVRGTRVVQEKRHFFCGAGRGLVTLTSEGAFYPCHRFAGCEDFRLGSLDEGIDDTKRAPFRTLHVDSRPGCKSCWARYLCGGGCWRHAYDAHGGLEQPDEAHSCRLIRRQIELAMAVNTILSVTDRQIIDGIFEDVTLSYLKA